MSEAVSNDLDKDLKTLVNRSKVPVVVGGSYAKHRHKALEELGTIPVGDDLIVGLHTLGRLLPTPSSH